jgi:hypothetical protein
LRGHGGETWHARLRTSGAGLLVGGLALTLAACGSSGGRQDATEPSGKFPVSIVRSAFPPRQQLAKTSDLTLGVKNTGKRPVPALAVTISIAGKQGQDSIQPFSVRDPQPGLAVPDRPVWILEQDYPKLVGGGNPGGAQTANSKTFDFGALKPGATRAAIWRVTPVKPGTYTVLYRIDAGLTGKAKAVTADGSPPQGSFHVTITSRPPLTRVNGKGQVVVVGSGGKTGGGQSQSSGKSTTGGGQGAKKNKTPKQPKNEAPAVPQGGGSLPPSGSGQ